MDTIIVNNKIGKVAEIHYDKGFPTRQEIDKVLNNFGHGEYELVAPNGRKWKVIKKDLTKYLAE